MWTQPKVGVFASLLPADMPGPGVFGVSGTDAVSVLQDLSVNRSGGVEKGHLVERAGGCGPGEGGRERLLGAEEQGPIAG